MTAGQRLVVPRRKRLGTPPVAIRLDLLARVLEELASVAGAEPDPVRANKLRGITRRFASALEVNRLHGVVFPAAWSKAISRRERPEARSAIRERVLSILADGRRAEMPLKAFLRHWEQGPIDGVRLTFDSYGQQYVVDDEDGDTGRQTYRLSTLTKMY